MTDKKIESLTPEQEATFPHYVDKWTKIGMATGPVDLEPAKAAVCLAYEKAGLPHPTRFFVAKSPIDAIRLIKELEPNFTEQEIFNDMTYGCHNAPWFSFYEFFRDEVKLDFVHQLDGLIELARHTGWLSMYDSTVVFQDRPETIRMDEQNRLHCETGPAIRYSDGFSIYAWHGVRIPAEFIEDKTYLTPKIALSWENIEQRRCAAEIIGWARIIDELDAEIIDEDGDPEIGTLLAVTIPDIGRELFLKVQCGTKRFFAIPVPPDMTSAIMANGWTFGLMPEDMLNLEVRT